MRMLLPVMDLLNHAGDEADFLLSDTARRADNVRWVAFHAAANLVQPAWLHGVKAALLCWQRLSCLGLTGAMLANWT